MFPLLMIVHIALCILLIIFVLLQQGKGADAGATFGGGSNTVFGASGASTVLTKATTGAAIAFILSALLLVKMYPEAMSGSNQGGILSDSIMTSGAESSSQSPNPIGVEKGPGDPPTAEPIN